MVRRRKRASQARGVSRSSGSDPGARHPQCRGDRSGARCHVPGILAHSGDDRSPWSACSLAGRACSSGQAAQLRGVRVRTANGANLTGSHDTDKAMMRNIASAFAQHKPFMLSAFSYAACHSRYRSMIETKRPDVL